MKRRYFPLLIVLCMAMGALSSCMEKNDPVPVKKNAYAGKWEGTFSGADNGTWSLTIGDQGEVDGKIYSFHFPYSPYHIKGTINNTGAFDAYSLAYGDTIIYVGQATDNLATGSWGDASQHMTGTWTGNRK